MLELRLYALPDHLRRYQAVTLILQTLKCLIRQLPFFFKRLYNRLLDPLIEAF